MSWVKLKGGIECGGCGKKDWCMISDKGNASLCMRVQSDRPFVLADGSVGYIHFHEGHAIPARIIREERRKPDVDINSFYLGLVPENKEEWREKLALNLGVSYSSIKAIGALWSKKHQAWAFPMKDGFSSLVGIRFRAMDGKKWALTGSKNALFIPLDDYRHQMVFLMEGPTDTCAANTIGLKSIGRPSCSAGLFDIQNFIQREHVSRMVIVADNDKPGLDGAAVLVRHLHIPSVTLTLPCKDMREFVRKGGTSGMLEAMARSMVWSRPC